MTTSIQCPPGTERRGMECVPLQGNPAGASDIEYYRQYLQDQPGYATPGQGDYTGMGTSAFHPFYGVPGKPQGSSVLSTPLISEYSGPTPTGRPRQAGGQTGGFSGGLAPFEISGRAAGQSGYDSGSVGRGYRVRETPKRMDAPFSMGDPYSQGGSLYNVGRMMPNRVDPYGGVDPTLLYDLRSRAAGGALVPPGYTAGMGRATPSEGTMSMPDLLNAAQIPAGSPLGRFYGGGVPAAGPNEGGGLLNVGSLLGGGAPAGAPSAPGGRGAPSRGGGGGKGTSKSSGSRSRPKTGAGAGAGATP